MTPNRSKEAQLRRLREGTALCAAGGAASPRVGLTLAAALLAGCDRQPARDTTTGEVRGEPITRLSALPPASAPATNPAIETPALVNGNSGKEPDFQMVGFDKLSAFTFEVSDELLGPVTNDLAAVAAKTDALIPETIKAFNKKPVQVRGFMLPLKVEGGLVTEMLLMKDQSMCCFGVVPKINEWISVKMVSKGIRPVMDEAVTLFGTLHVGEMRENGYLVGIYRMDGQKMASALDN
ncbi:MAG TPA: hypothetical protein VNO52_04160 [Methylomirabilota bacterium]|nr:hypothetical protein [Methylomirabilota bacterium]